MVRVALSQERKEQSTEPQRSNRRQNCQTVTAYGTAEIVRFCNMTSAHRLLTCRVSSKANRKQPYVLIVAVHVYHPAHRFRFSLYASQPWRSGMPVFWDRSRLSRDGAVPSSPIAVCARTALLSCGTSVA